MKQILLALPVLGLLASCGRSQSQEEPLQIAEVSKTQINESEPERSKAMYEIAINQAKEGQMETFLSTRAKFVEVLGKEDATLNEGKWKPFFAVNPEIDLDRVLIGMTHWSSLEGFGEAASRLMPQPVAIDYFSSFDPLAYALLETLDGQPFDLESIKKEGRVVEFAIRHGKTSDAFGARRETFFQSLKNYEGYEFAREFKVHKLNDQGVPTLAENTQAVIIVWEGPEEFQAAATPIFSSKEYQEFAENLDVETYFASFPVR